MANVGNGRNNIIKIHGSIAFNLASYTYFLTSCSIRDTGTAAEEITSENPRWARLGYWLLQQPGTPGAQPRRAATIQPASAPQGALWLSHRTASSPRRVIPPGSAHRRPLVPCRLCHAVSAFRLAIKSCHDWRDGGTCPAGIGDCDIARCSCRADEPLSFFICPGGVGAAADGEATDWGEDDLRDRDCRRWCRFKIFPANLASVSA